MQNRGALWIFTILLALACLWQLSFSFFTSRMEKRARVEAGYSVDSLIQAEPAMADLDRDSLEIIYENRYLRTHGDEQVYPVFGYSYAECKEREMNMGLDLKGGMAVTLEVSVPELVENLSGNSTDPSFQAAMNAARQRMLSSDADFITLFGEEYAKVEGRGPLSAIFYTPDRSEIFARDGSDEDYIAALRKEANSAVENTERIMRTRIDKFGVAQPLIQKQAFSGRIQIELPGVKDKERVRKVLQSTANLEFWETVDNEVVYPVLERINTRLGQIAVPVDSTTAMADTTVADTAALADAAVAADTTAAVDSLLADTANQEMTEAERAELRRKNPLFAVFQPSNQAKGPIVGTALVADTGAVNGYLRSATAKSLLPADVKLAWTAKPDSYDTQDGGKVQVLSLYALKVPRGGKPRLDGSSIVTANQDFDYKGAVEVNMQMDAEGAQVWRLMTGENIGRVVAIVLDDYVYSGPVVQGEISGGRSSISMGSGDLNKQIQEAEDLANILKAGALPAPARIIDETVVGPSLGEENINKGLVSFGIALIGVLLVMGLYYARAGWIADVALMANVFFLLGSMASLQATLTLSGIAGIVLTIGMAVDANVLINERVRDEMKAGRALRPALEAAFSNQGALSAILDSNITSFITAVILYYFGSGPIRGFATTLGLGILTSLFTAIFIARLIMMWRLEKGKTITFWNKWSENLLANANYDFMGKRKMYYAISFVLVAMSIGAMVTRGFNLGVDFSGGRTYVVDFKDNMDSEQVKATLEPLMTDASGRQYTVTAKTYGSQHQLKITTNYLIDELDASTDGKVEAKLREGLALTGVDYRIEETRKVDATISDDIKRNAAIAVSIALVFMFIYIGIRFNNLSYGLSALISLFHDVVIVLGLYALLWGILPISLEIDEAFIGVILTVIGYSINDTVVVFDRIREYLRDHKREDTVTVFNKALNSTLRRTVNTGFCTLLVLVVIYLFGGVAIKGFVFGIFFGVLVGTYSSIFIGSGIAVDLVARLERKKVKEAKYATA
ncbi:MAG: protein translocase subunit SecDF [Flavobacteriales bacterium]